MICKVDSGIYSVVFTAALFVSTVLVIVTVIALLTCKNINVEIIGLRSNSDFNPRETYY